MAGWVAAAGALLAVVSFRSVGVLTAAALAVGFVLVTLAVVGTFRRSAEFAGSPPTVQAFVGSALGLVLGAVLLWALLFVLWAPAWSAAG